MSVARIGSAEYDIDSIGTATLVSPEPEGVDDRGDVKRLLSVLRQPDPPPARVKVRPLGHTEMSKGITRIFLHCAAGFSATCTEHGELNTYGARYVDVVGDLIARGHLRMEHR